VVTTSHTVTPRATVTGMDEPETPTTHPARMYARLTDGSDGCSAGTAMAETALCSECITLNEHNGALDTEGLVDCTGNEALECQNCGRHDADVAAEPDASTWAVPPEGWHLKPGPEGGANIYHDGALVAVVTEAPAGRVLVTQTIIGGEERPPCEYREYRASGVVVTRDAWTVFAAELTVRPATTATVRL